MRRLDLLRFSSLLKLMILENGKLDLEMKPRLLQRARPSLLQMQLGTRFLSLPLRRVVRPRLRRLTLMTRPTRDTIHLLKKMELRLPTLFLSRMLFLKMLACMSCPWPTELVTWRSKLAWPSLLRSHPSPNPLLMSPPLLVLPPPLLLVLLVCPSRLSSGTRVTRSWQKVRGDCLKRRPPRRGPSIR